MTEAEIEAAARAARLAYWGSRTKESPELWLEVVRAALAAAEAVRKPDLVPGLERAREIVAARFRDWHNSENLPYFGMILTQAISAEIANATEAEGGA
jgi:hypothetical protein